MNENLREDVIEAIEAGAEVAKSPVVNKIQKIVNEHPWIPLVSNGLLGIGIYRLGKKAGVKKVVKNLTGNKDVVTAKMFDEGIDRIFEHAATILDCADELSSLVKRATVVKK